MGSIRQQLKQCVIKEDLRNADGPDGLLILFTAT